MKGLLSVRHSGNDGLKVYPVTLCVCVFLSTDGGSSSSSEAAMKITQTRYAAAVTLSEIG